MVLEFIFKIKFIRKHPILILAQSILLSSIAIWIAFAVFPDSASITALTFTTIGLLPLIYSLLMQEEKIEEKEKSSFWERHLNLIHIFAWFFIGLIASYSFWFLVLPEEPAAACFGSACIQVPVKGKVFLEQESTLSGIRGKVSLSGAFSKQDCFGETSSIANCTGFIFENNATVLSLAVLFSFLYGAGAVFLLAWNASIIGTLIGKEAVIAGTASAGLLSAIALLPHGIPEIIAYFIGAIAGGIISAAIIRGKFGTHEFEQVAKDALLLIILAFAILLAAAVIEAIAIVGL